jgi:hypothetical protein
MEEQEKTNITVKLTMDEFRESLKNIHNKAEKELGYNLEYRLNPNSRSHKNKSADPNYALMARNENADVRFVYNIENQVYVVSISKDELLEEGLRIYSDHRAIFGASKNHATNKPILNISTIKSTALGIFGDLLEIYAIKNYGKKNIAKYVSRNHK